jgi:hypothetical protein
MTWTHQLEKRTEGVEWRWEHIKGGWHYVVEKQGNLRTGPFITKEKAIEWYRRELDVELVTREGK